MIEWPTPIVTKANCCGSESESVFELGTPVRKLGFLPIIMSGSNSTRSMFKADTSVIIVFLPGMEERIKISEASDH